MSKKIPAAKHLSDREYDLFLKIHAKHIKSMGLDFQQMYSLSQIVKVEKNFKEKCLNVYFKNGDWWHYTPAGKWF